MLANAECAASNDLPAAHEFNGNGCGRIASRAGEDKLALCTDSIMVQRRISAVTATAMGQGENSGCMSGPVRNKGLSFTRKM